MLHKWPERGPMRDVHRLMGAGSRDALCLFRSEEHKENRCWLLGYIPPSVPGSVLHDDVPLSQDSTGQAEVEHDLAT